MEQDEVGRTPLYSSEWVSTLGGEGRSRRSHQQSQHALKYRRCEMGWGLRKKILSGGGAVKVMQE